MSFNPDKNINQKELLERLEKCYYNVVIDDIIVTKMSEAQYNVYRELFSENPIEPIKKFILKFGDDDSIEKSLNNIVKKTGRDYNDVIEEFIIETSKNKLKELKLI